MHSTFSRRSTLVLLGSIMAVAATAPAVAQDAGVSTVRNFTSQLARIGESASVRDRYARLQPLVRQTFDIGGMLRIALGTHASSVSGGDRATLEREFANFIAANYANRVHGTAGLRIEVQPAATERGGQRLVRTEFVEANGTRTTVSYATRGSRVIDVYLDGSISELASRRAEFGSIIASSGASGLIETLRQRTARFLAG